MSKDQQTQEPTETKAEGAEFTSEELSRFGKYLASHRRTDVQGVCPVCGRTFTGPAKKRYDRHSCAVIASRRKRQAEQAKEPAGQ